MKKVKKWQIVVLVILGVGGYWIYNYPWLLEKKVSIDLYDENIVGVWEKVNSSDYTSVNVTEYFEDHTFERRTTEKKPRRILSGTWKIEDEFLVLTYDDEGFKSYLVDYNIVYEKIIFFTERHIRLHQDRPIPVGGFQHKQIERKISY